MKKRLLSCTAAIALGFLSVHSVTTQGYAQEIVQEIIVVGAQRIEPDTVRSYMQLQPGDPYNTRNVNRSLKRLFATGLFADVTIRQEGANLVVNVVENPVINRIAFEGNQQVSDEILDSEISLRPRVIYTRTRVQQDVERILTIYRRSGRFAATVEPKVIQLDQNRIDLAFEINEGEQTGVERIRFVGNKEFSDGKLSEVIRTRQTRWYNFLTSEDNYDPDRLNFDKELLRRYYMNRGYADFKVTSAVAELSPSREEFFITFTVDEGPRYEIASVSVNNELQGLETETVDGVSILDEGDWYNAEDVDLSVENYIDRIGQQGFPFVRVSPEINRNTEERTIDLTYNIEEGPRIFVEKININGNFRTLDKVVRREFQLVEGDALNIAKLRRSRKRINDLNFFENVEFSQSPGSGPDQTVIDVTVEEKSTGSLSIGAGFSSDDGPLAELGITETNLLGKGQRLAFSTSISGDRNLFNISFTEPYFLERELAAGFDLYKDEEDNQDESSFDSDRLGVTFRVNYPFSEYTTQSWSYNLDETTLENIDDDASLLIQAQEGTEITSSITHGLSYDRRDSRSNPTDGYRLSLTNTVAGLGGTVAFLRNEARATYYYPLEDQWIFHLRGRVGHIVGLGEDVKIQNRFFLGGANLRGFEDRGVGPRDNRTEDALGGEYIYNATAEMRFPLGLPSEYQISGSVFTDVGSLSELEPKNNQTLDDRSIRLSSGVGINWTSPFGPIGLSYAVPVLDEDYDQEENFRVNFGTRF